MLAIDRRGRGEHHPPHALGLRGEQDVERAAHIHRMCLRGRRHALWHRGDRCLMQHDLDATACCADRLTVAHVARDPLDLAEDVRQACPSACGAVVEHAHTLAALNQRTHEMRADEAGASSHEIHKNISPPELLTKRELRDSRCRYV